MLKKGLILAALCVALLVPAVAEASPRLSGSEARRALGAELHESARYGAMTGTLRARCYNASRSLVRCYISFLDKDGDAWCGPASVRETRYSYYFRWNLSLC